MKVRWTAGGHDAGSVSEDDAAAGALGQEIADWFDHYLRRGGDAPAADFAFDQQTGLSSSRSRATRTCRLRPTHWATRSRRRPCASAQEQAIVRPAGSSGLAVQPPRRGVDAGLHRIRPAGSGRAVLLRTAGPVGRRGGSSTVRLTVSGAPQGTVLFAKVYDVAPDGRPRLPQGQVVPVSVPASVGERSVEVVLPALAHRFETGHRIVVAIATTDRAYASSSSQQIVRVALADARSPCRQVAPRVRPA